MMIRPSVVYRTGPITAEDYAEAIEALERARDQGTRGYMCAICEDTGHQAQTCHHNPLLLARRWAEATCIFVCYHCAFIATTDQEAREHFGDPALQDPAKCRRPSAEIARASFAQPDQPEPPNPRSSPVLSFLEAGDDGAADAPDEGAVFPGVAGEPPHSSSAELFEVNENG
jgi:hypothetical protein